MLFQLLIEAGALVVGPTTIWVKATKVPLKELTDRIKIGGTK